ncbi:hypothetical protein HCN44_001476 [Aphidius gifuensis]|uniref:Uncharacterized protein n=1 Tax=Aphidius gifuensis TaxID=684658 RepID=A0A834XTY2_APHGI|nr:hypothetical protein HCN44_001476 [Aphidius gifuensis]
MESGTSKMQKKSTFNEIALSDYKKTINEEANKRIEIIRLSLDCNEIDFTDYCYHILTQADVEFILSHCGMNLNKLILYDPCDSKIMLTVKKYCQNLEELDFSLSNINEDDFIDVFTDMRKLKSLTVRPDSLFGKRKEYPVDIAKILDSVPVDINKLILNTYNVLRWSDTFKDPRLQVFPQALGRFQKLCYLMLMEYDIDNNAVIEISKIKSLIELEFIYCKIKEGTSFILNLPELQSLTLDDMDSIDDCIINLPNESKNLKCLTLRNRRAVSAGALKKIANLINLEALDMDSFEGVDGDVFVSIVKGCKKLKSLEISYCPEISGDDLLEISNLKNLECLEFYHTKNLNDDVIIKIANNCKKITKLSMKKCKNVSMLAHNKLAKLKSRT